MTAVFKPIRQKKLSEEIIVQIKKLISDGDLGPGQKIPSERDLAAELGVSRPSVREALMVLEALGFLESRQGGGTYVRPLGDVIMPDPLTDMIKHRDPMMLHALTEVRSGLESWSAYLAAKRAKTSEIEHLRELYASMVEHAKKGQWSATLDIKFHLTIASASHNSLQVHILHTIQELFQTTIMVALEDFYSKEGHIEQLLSQHREILEAIEARNPELARSRMQQHLTLVEEKLAVFLPKEKSYLN